MHSCFMNNAGVSRGIKWYPEFGGGLIKAPLKLWRGVVITSVASRWGHWCNWLSISQYQLISISNWKWQSKFFVKRSKKNPRFAALLAIAHYFNFIQLYSYTNVSVLQRRTMQCRIWQNTIFAHHAYLWDFWDQPLLEKQMNKNTKPFGIRIADKLISIDVPVNSTSLHEIS